MKQCLLKKPIKRGFPVLALADSNNGYFTDMQGYVGKENAITDHGLGKLIVLDLTAPMVKTIAFFCNNYFTFPCLLKEFLNRGTYARGTICST